MKVCILSMQKVQNFGSLLQSYALMRCLEELDCSVGFIDIKSNPDDDAIKDKKVNIHREEYESKRPGIFGKINRYFIVRLLNKKKAKAQDSLFEEFRTQMLKIKTSDNEKHYDLCVIGSDEVFNCLENSSWGFTSQLFGNVQQSDRVITYAASCGATEAEQLNEGMREVIARTFKRVSGLSVRDDNTKKFVESMTSQPVELHLDPVWVADFDTEIKSATIPYVLPKKYCVVYSYMNRICRDEDITAISEFCKSKGMEPVALGAPQFWIPKYYPLTPFEALKLIQNAQFVITDTFHGTIFSEKYNGHYAVLTRTSNQNKLMDLISRLELKSHLITSFADLEKVYGVHSNRKWSAECQRSERERTIRYLRAHTKGCAELSINGEE